MQSLITSYLLQSGECPLAGIGTLYLKKISARINNTDNQILPPSEEITFNKENSNSSELIKYIAGKENISLKEAEDAYNNSCKEWEGKISAGEKLILATIGYLQADKDEKIYFEREKPFDFYKPIYVEKIYTPAVTLAADNNDASDETLENNIEENEVVVERSHWGWWAVILAAIALAAIFYQFKDQKFNGSSAGNQKHIVTDSVSATYQVPNK